MEGRRKISLLLWLAPLVAALIIAFAQPAGAVAWINSTSAGWERRYQAVRRGGIFRRVWRALLWVLHKLHGATEGIVDEAHRAAVRLVSFFYAAGLALFVLGTMIYIALMLAMLAIGLWIVGAVLGVDTPSPRIRRSHSDEGRSRQRKDWMGNDYTEYVDRDGTKTGEGRERKDWAGNSYTERTDADGNTEGTSRTRTDWAGNDYTEHVDSDGNKTGESRDRKDWAGNDYTEHTPKD